MEWITKIKDWRAVSAYTVSGIITIAYLISSSNSDIDKAILSSISFGLIGIIVYTIKRFFDKDSEEARIAATHFGSNLETIDEISRSVVDCFRDPKYKDKHDCLQFMLKELAEYRQRLVDNATDDENSQNGSKTD